MVTLHVYVIFVRGICVNVSAFGIISRKRVGRLIKIGGEGKRARVHRQTKTKERRSGTNEKYIDGGRFASCFGFCA